MKKREFITIEIQQTDLKSNQQLLRELFSYVITFYFHFFFEPNLIIRVDKSHAEEIIKYLKIKHLKFKSYSYPDKGKYKQGSVKKDVVTKYFSSFRELFFINSCLALIRDPKDDLMVIERESHTLINCFGYSWEEEALIYLKLGRSRIGAIRKYNNLSPFLLLYCSFLRFLIQITIFLGKGLKYSDQESV